MDKRRERIVGAARQSAMTELKWTSLAAFETGEDSHYEMTLLCYLLLQRGHELIDFDSQYRAIARDEALARHQKSLCEQQMLLRLQQLVTNGYLAAIISFWDDRSDLNDADSFPEVLKRLESFAERHNCKAAFPLWKPTRSFAEGGQRLAKFVDRVKKSECYARLRKPNRESSTLHVTVPQKSSKLPTDSCLHHDIDRVFLCTCCALQLFMRDLFCADLEDIRSIVRQSRARSRQMWRKLNRRINISVV